MQFWSRGSRGGMWGWLYHSVTGWDVCWVGESGEGREQRLELERRREDGQLHPGLDLLFPELLGPVGSAMCSSCQLSQDLWPHPPTRWVQWDRALAQQGSVSSLTGFGDIKEDQYKPFEVTLSSCT